MRAQLVVTVLLHLSYCLAAPVDETAIAGRSEDQKVDEPVELPPFEMPMRLGPFGWTRILPQVDTTGRNPSQYFQPGSQVHYLSESGLRPDGPSFKTWTVDGETEDRLEKLMDARERIDRIETEALRTASSRPIY